jgi:hypothetical protein
VVQVLRDGHTGLLAPVALRAVLGVIEQVIFPRVLKNARLIETAAFPRCAVLRSQNRRIGDPIAQVLAAAKSNNGGALLVSRVGVGVIDA